MPTKDKEKKNKNCRAYVSRMRLAGYKRNWFWMETAWDGNLEEMGKYVLTKEKKKEIKEIKDKK